MRPTSLSRLAALLCCAALAACADTRGSGIPTTSDPVVSSTTPAPRPNLATGNAACTPVTAAQLRTLATTAFGAGSPDVQSVIGKIGQLETAVLAGDYVTAGQVGFTIIEFTLRKNSQRALGGTKADITAFVNAVACYAGLNFVIEDPDVITIVNPTDGPQIIYSDDRLAGISLPANAVGETTIFSIVPIPFTPTDPGDGPLNTKLDQYRGFYNFTKTSANNLPLLQNVIVGVCAPASLSADLFARLRLGHDAEAGFRLEPPAPADFLDCSTAYTTADPAPKTDFFGSGFLGQVAALFTPREAFAAVSTAFFAGGGVGGLASELSPFAPVDATVSFAGGVGGLASELRVLTLAATPNSCSGTEAPAGNAIEAGCRPKVVLTTLLGTPLTGAPVTFTATVGGGRVAPQNADGTCGTFATQITTATLADGSAQVCWTLGSTAGTNRLRAVGGIGGDVPPGVTYSDARFFTATGNPPVGFVFQAQPAAGAQIVAGTAIPVTAALVDKNGVTVTSYTGTTTLALQRGTTAANFSTGTSQITATAVAGVVTFPGVSITAANTGYALRVLNGTFTLTGNTFDVVAASAKTMTIFQGDNQTALAGTLLPVAPTVRVVDNFGNPVPNVTVNWLAGGASGSAASAPTSTTGANGLASIGWTIGAGVNELSATATGTNGVIFKATGTTPTLATLNQCPTGGSGDPFNDPSKPFAFFIPDPGNGKTIREITVYISSSGQANDTTAHDLRLTVTRATFDPNSTPIQTATARTFLRGNNSETKAVTFTLPEPIVGASGQSARRVMLRLSTFGPNAATAKLNFNSGTCSPNSTNCRVPNTCRVTEVSSPLPYPEGTFYRQSVGLLVRGN